MKFLLSYRILTLIGGVFPTFAPEFILNHEGIDMVCVGEGENVIVELCDRLDKGFGYKNISNLWVKCTDGSVVRNSCSPPVDINTLPVPDFSLFEEIRFFSPFSGDLYKTLPIETSRSCTFQCGFCNSPSQRKLFDTPEQKYFRKKRIGTIHNELTSLINNHSPEFIYFFSDTFLLFTEKDFSEFIEMYSEIKLPFWMCTRADTITDDRIKRLKDVGLYRMSIGVEHGNEDFRKKVLKKSISNITIKRAVEIIHSVDLPTGLTINNMVGFPLETRVLAMDTVNFANELSRYVDSTSVSIFQPFTGTALRELAVRMGYMDNSTVVGTYLYGESLLNMPNFPKEEINGIFKCFTLYMFFDKSRWSEIRRAEKNTPEGNKIFNDLMKEYKATYIK